MLLFLLGLLHDFWGIKIPAVFSYTSTRMLFAAATSLLFTIFFGPFFIRKLYSLKIGQTIRTKDECPVLAELHSKKKDTPTMGGVLILSAMFLSLLFWMDLKSSFTWIFLFTIFAIGIIGGRDDYLKLKYKNSKGLRSRLKFLYQVVFASVIASYLFFPAVSSFLEKKLGVEKPVVKEFISKKEVKQLTVKEYASRIYLPFLKKPIFELDGIFAVFAFLFVITVISGSSNAVNLTDGLDGLASGCLILVSLVLASVAFFSNNYEMARYLNILYIEGGGEIAIFLFSIIGAALGFLWYNSYPAQIFMGDVGSLTLGAVVGVAAVLLRREFLLALVGGIFVVEALSVIMQVLSYRYRNKKRIFLCAPLHHHFEYRGWAETKVVMRFWIVGLLLAIIGIASLKFQ